MAPRLMGVDRVGNRTNCGSHQVVPQGSPASWGQAGVFARFGPSHGRSLRVAGLHKRAVEVVGGLHLLIPLTNSARVLSDTPPGLKGRRRAVANLLADRLGVTQIDVADDAIAQSRGEGWVESDGGIQGLLVDSHRDTSNEGGKLLTTGQK
jgi:hypothetical protein